MSINKDPVICLSSNWDCMTTIFQLHLMANDKLLQRSSVETNNDGSKLFILYHKFYGSRLCNSRISLCSS